MSTKTCSCGVDLNFGVKKTSKFGAVTRIGIMDYVDSDGNVNSLDLGVDWDTAYWATKTDNADFTKRLHLSLPINEFNPSAEDSVTQTRPNGVIIKVRDGIVTYEMLFDNVDKVFYDALKSRECKDNGVFLFDECSSVAGNANGTAFEVAKIAPNSFDVQFIPATNADNARVRLRFNLDLNETPVFDIVRGSDITGNPLTVQALYDGEKAADPTTATTTQLVVDLKIKSAIFKNADYVKLEGADTPANWTITDSTGATSNPTTVTEANGNYTLDYAAITAGVTKFHYLDDVFEVVLTETVA
jgi:hypothetical protein